MRYDANARAMLVQGLYQSYLGRPADAAGPASWVNILLAGATQEVVVPSLVGSDEYFRRGHSRP